MPAPLRNVLRENDLQIITVKVCKGFYDVIPSILDDCLISVATLTTLMLT